MKEILAALIFSFSAICCIKSQSLKSPDEFLGYELGTQFTYHHKAVEYFRYIADNPYFRAFWKSGRVLPGNVVLR